MNLKQSMELAGQNLLNCLCPTRNYLPYWCLRVDRDYRAEFVFNWPAHNIGRWWDAMLRLEHGTGFIIPAHIEAAMLKNLYRFFDNSDNLCFAPLEMEGVEPFFELHSLRESLLALNALARYRNSRWASHKGHLMLETIQRISREDSSWDLDKIDYYHRVDKRLERHLDPTGSSGRLIEALVWFYETTRNPLALKLADRFARYQLLNITKPDGTLDMTSKPNHTHSYLGTLRGLLLFGVLTNQRKYVDAVAATYRAAVRGMVKESGWTCHDIHPHKGTHRPEVTSPGDAAQLALWLALYAGYAEFLDDAERIVRSRLIRSQVTESPDLHPVVDDGEDEHTNLSDRVLGGFGGMHREPHAGKQNTTDITAAVLHTLIDIYHHIVVPTSAGWAVYFHFDYEDENICITSERKAEARVTILPKANQDVLVRIPQWTPPESVHIAVNGKPISKTMLGVFVHVPIHILRGEIMLKYALPIRRSVEEISGVKYEFTWRGDEIIGICPGSDFYPFYPTAEGCKQGNVVSSAEI